MAASNTSAAQPSDSATSPTTSPDHYSRLADSDHDYTLDCEEPQDRWSQRSHKDFAQTLGGDSHRQTIYCDLKEPFLSAAITFP